MAVCTIGKYCEVNGLVDLCKDFGECVAITNIVFVRGRGSFLLPSQDTPNFYNAKMCRDHQVLSAILTATKGMLQTRVTVAGSDGPTTSYDPDDIRLEAVRFGAAQRSEGYPFR